MKLIYIILTALCFTLNVNADSFRDWESRSSNKRIHAKVIDIHEGKAHLILKATRKGYWVKVDDLSNVDQEYLKTWVLHEDRMFFQKFYVEGRLVWHVVVKHSNETQTLKISSKIGDTTPKIFEISDNKESESSKFQLTADQFDTGSFDLYSCEGSLIDSKTQKGNKSSIKN